MTLTIDLTPTEQERVTNAARQIGLDLAELIRKLVREHLHEAADAECQSRTAAQNGANRNHFYFTATCKEFNNVRDGFAK